SSQLQGRSHEILFIQQSPFSWKLKYPLNARHCCMDSRTNSNKLFFFGDFTPPDFRRMPTLCRCRFL
ncbi:hypothetical protein QIH53_26095, partial [Klebsiella pneumoniae]|nr:hypothetical protein [Klebsiella pneumoniae]